MVQQTEKMSNLLAYFEWAIDQIVITVNHCGETVAWVPTTSSNDPYTVWIDESSKVPHATKCSCNDHWYRKSYCKHMQCADLYYQSIAAIFAKEEVAEPVVEETVSLEQAMQEAQNEMVEIIEEAAIAGDKSYAKVVTDAYEIAGSTKKVTGAKCVTEWVFSLACPHMVPAGKEHEECGACLDKLYG